MELISKDILCNAINNIKLKDIHNNPMALYRIVLKLIEEMPIAYDVERVVEELEEHRRICFLTIANTGDEQLDIVYDYVSSAIEKAIEIVKSGGADA